MATPLIRIAARLLVSSLVLAGGLTTIAGGQPSEAAAPTMDPAAVRSMLAAEESAWLADTSTQAGVAKATRSDIQLLRATFVDEGYKIVSAAVDAEQVRSSTARSGVVTATTRLELEDLSSGERTRSSFRTTRSVTLDKANVVGSTLAADDGVAPTKSQGTPPPNPSSSVRPKQSPALEVRQKTAGTMRAAGVGPINYRAQADYAIKWSKSEDAHFSVYGDAGNNCANLSSQALDNAGWNPFQDGLTRGSMKTWTYKYVGPGRFSYTWSRANYQERFMRETAGKSRLGNIWYAGLGDLLYTDWDPNLRPDGTIDHVMIVSGFTPSNNPRISQQSPPRSNIPLSTSIELANQQGRVITWYGIRT